MSVGSISNLINGAGFDPYSKNNIPSSPVTGGAALLQILQSTNAVSPPIAGLINGAGFGSPAGSSLSGLISSSQNSIGSLIDRYA